MPEDFPQLPEFQQKAQARDAIQKIGTNALPFLLHRLNHEPPRYYKSLWDNPVARHAPPWLSNIADKLCGDQFRKVHDAVLACSGFDALGTNALAAIPDLAIISTNYVRPLASSLATDALGHLGFDALPALLSARSNCPPSHRDRINAVLAVSLVPRLNNTDPVPFLLRFVVDENADLRQAATNALWRIAPEILTNTPAK